MVIEEVNLNLCQHIIAFLFIDYNLNRTVFVPKQEGDLEMATNNFTKMKKVKIVATLFLTVLIASNASLAQTNSTNGAVLLETLLDDNGIETANNEFD